MSSHSSEERVACVRMSMLGTVCMCRVGARQENMRAVSRACSVSTSLFRRFSFDCLSPVLWQADADQWESLDFAFAVIVVLRLRHARVTLNIGLPIFCLATSSYTSGPAIVPDTDDFHHVATLKVKLVGGARFVGP